MKSKITEKHHTEIRAAFRKRGITGKSRIEYLHLFRDEMHGHRRDGLTRDEIAEIFGVSFPTVKAISAAFPLRGLTRKCSCGCGREFPVDGKRKYFDVVKCRYVAEKKGEVKQHEERDEHPWRQTYCHQTIDGYYTECARYNESCGADCHREKHGVSVCFVMPMPAPNSDWLRLAGVFA